LIEFEEDSKSILKENDQLKEQLEEQLKKSLDLKNLISELDSQIHNSKNSNEDNIIVKSELEKELLYFQEKYKKLEEEIDNLNSLIEGEKDTTNNLSKEIEIMKEENLVMNKLQVELDEKQTKLVELQLKYDVC
jgi:hypothetical protein